MKQDDHRSDRIFVVIAAIYIAICSCILILHNLGIRPGYVKLEKTFETEETINVSDQNETLIDINTATAEELMTLDGIGEATARKIIEYRENNNGFLTVDELTEVNGIGSAKLEKIRNRVTVGNPPAN